MRVHGYLVKAGYEDLLRVADQERLAAEAAVWPAQSPLFVGRDAELSSALATNVHRLG
jgi:hypothetical protein